MKTKPDTPINAEGFWHDEIGHTHGGVGLTKREYFAAMALQGLASDPNITLKNAAEISVKLADALIAELNYEPSE